MRSKARAVLGKLPQKVEIEASGNMIKNAKSVIVPNTDGRKGMEAAAAIGIVAGQEEMGLEVLRDVTEGQRKELSIYLEKIVFSVKHADSELLLDIIVRVYSGDSSAVVRIANTHTNIVYISKNDEVLLEKRLNKNNRII